MANPRYIKGVTRNPSQHDQVSFYPNDNMGVHWEYAGGLDTCKLSIRSKDNHGFVSNVFPPPNCIAVFQDLIIPLPTENNSFMYDGKTDYVVQVQGPLNTLPTATFR